MPNQHAATPHLCEKKKRDGAKNERNQESLTETENALAHFAFHFTKCSDKLFTPVRFEIPSKTFSTKTVNRLDFFSYSTLFRLQLVDRFDSTAANEQHC